MLIKLVPVSGCPASDGASALDLSASGPAGDEATAAARPGPARASVADTTTTNDPSIRRAGLTRDFVLWSVRVVAPAPITKLHSPSYSQRSLCNDCNFNRRPTEDVENTTSFLSTISRQPAGQFTPNFARGRTLVPNVSSPLLGVGGPRRADKGGNEIFVTMGVNGEFLHFGGF